MARMRKSPRRQLEQELARAVGSDTTIHIDRMSAAKIKDRIQAIRFWDKLKRFECPMCGALDSLHLNSKVKHALNLQCTSCTAHYAMSLSRSLGAKLVIRP